MIATYHELSLGGGEIIWGSILLLALAFEVWAIFYRPDWTLTRVTQRLFRTTYRVGAWIFIVTWGVFTAWFTWHILLP